jgi:hypothetical protein
LPSVITSAAKINNLKTSQQTHLQKRRQDEAALAAAYAKADLPGKMDAVRTKNHVYQADLETFIARGSKDARDLGKSEVLRQSCLTAILDYNRTAATFSDTVRGSQPAQIDMKDQTLNCGVRRWPVSSQAPV